MKDQMPVEVVERSLWRCLAQGTFVEGSDLRVGNDSLSFLEFIPAKVDPGNLRCWCGGHVVPVSLSDGSFAERHPVIQERRVKRYLTLISLFAVVAMALPFTSAAFADEPAASSAITHYIQNARTPEDHQAIAAYFDSEAARATATAEQYKEFNCHRSQSTELQRSGTQFPEVNAKQHCRKMLRHYLTRAEEDRMLAEYHRNVANNGPPSSVSSPGNYE